MTITRLAILLLCFISVTSCKVSYKKNINPDIGAGFGGGGGGGDWTGSGVYLNAKVCLEGAVNPLSVLPLEMVYTLNTNQTLPYITPYTLAAPWLHYSASDIALNPFIYDDGDPSTGGWVDWVLVEVYSYNYGYYAKVDAQSALLYWDGRLFNTSGQQGLFFSTLLPGDYYINIKHRNHLAIANQTAVSLTVQSQLDFDTNVFELDFTNVLTITTGATATVAGNQCMLAGDVNSDNIINSVDLGLLNTQVDSIFPSAVHNTTLNGYFSSDTNFDGTIKKDTALIPSTLDHELIYDNSLLPIGTIFVHPDI